MAHRANRNSEGRADLHRVQACDDAGSDIFSAATGQPDRRHRLSDRWRFNGIDGAGHPSFMRLV
jgi:hypothetical protein